MPGLVADHKNLCCYNNLISSVIKTNGQNSIASKMSGAASYNKKNGIAISVLQMHLLPGAKF